MILSKSTNRLTVLGVLLAAATLSASAPAADTADAFMKGGTFCFRLDGGGLGALHQTWKMVVKPAAGGGGYKEYRIASIAALEHGTQVTAPPSLEYMDEFAGSATIASPNDRLPGPRELQIGLVGTSYGAHGPESVGLWKIDYALVLDLANLTGKIKGIKAFTAIVDGTGVPANPSVVDGTVSPISCRDF